MLLRSELSIEVQVEVLEAQNSVHFEFEKMKREGKPTYCPLQRSSIRNAANHRVHNVILVEDPSPRDVPVDEC